MTKIFYKYVLVSALLIIAVSGCMPQARNEVSVSFELPNTVSVSEFNQDISTRASCSLSYSSICATKLGAETKCVDVAASTDPSAFSGISSGDAVLTFAPVEEMTLTAGVWNFYYLGVFGTGSCTTGDSVVSFGSVNKNIVSSLEVPLTVVTPADPISINPPSSPADGFTNAQFQITDSEGGSCVSAGTISVTTGAGGKAMTLPDGVNYVTNLNSGSGSLQLGPLPQNMPLVAVVKQTSPSTKQFEIKFTTDSNNSVSVTATASNLCESSGGGGAGPTAPSGLTVGSPTSSSLTLSWSDNSSDEVGFAIESSANGTSGWAVITTTSANATSFVHSGLSPSQTVFYRLRAIGSSGNSAYTAVASGTTSSGGGGGGGGILTIDGGAVFDYGVTSVGVNVDHTFTVTNTSGSATATGMSGNMSSAEFIFIGGSYPGTSGTCGSSLAPGASCTLTTRFNPSAAMVLTGTLEISYTNGTSQAVTQALTGDASGGGGGAPSTPTSFFVSQSSGPGITLTWADVTGETGYKIERKIGSGGSYTEIATAMSNATSYDDTTATTSGTTYYYRIRAYNVSGDSGYSSEESLTYP